MRAGGSGQRHSSTLIRSLSLDEYPPPCPVLRKDFTIDAIQIAEAAVAGADAILLIVAALGKEKTVELLKAAQDIGKKITVKSLRKQSELI